MARRLTRNPHGAMVGGVAAGFADYFDVDPVIVRLGFVLLAFADGIGVVFYLVCWVVMPSGKDAASEPGSTQEQVADQVRAAGEQVRAAGEQAARQVREAVDAGRGHLIAGGILIALGLVFLLERLSWVFPRLSWFYLGNLWPLILVAIGLVLLLRAREGRA